jgi:hypothetical protein
MVGRISWKLAQGRLYLSQGLKSNSIYTFTVNLNDMLKVKDAFVMYMYTIRNLVKVVTVYCEKGTKQNN